MSVSWADSYFRLGWRHRGLTMAGPGCSGCCTLLLQITARFRFDPGWFAAVRVRSVARQSSLPGCRWMLATWGVLQPRVRPVRVSGSRRSGGLPTLLRPWRCGSGQDREGGLTGPDDKPATDQHGLSAVIHRPLLTGGRRPGFEQVFYDSFHGRKQAVPASRAAGLDSAALLGAGDGSGARSVAGSDPGVEEGQFCWGA
jgi:hypothetical protein